MVTPSIPISLFFDITLVFALIIGTAAGLLSLLNWEIFRHSAFGRVIAAFAFFIFIYVVYHGVALLLEPAASLVHIIESVMYTGLFVFILAMIIHHREITARIEAEGAP